MKNFNNNRFRKGIWQQVGGLYPMAEVEDQVYDQLADIAFGSELAGLTPDGWPEDSQQLMVDIDAFDLEKVLEVRETALNYFIREDGPDEGASLQALLDLVNDLHSTPDSHCKGQLKPGELILAMSLAGVGFCRDHAADGGVTFFLNWQAMMDLSMYMQDDPGFGGLVAKLRPRQAN